MQREGGVADAEASVQVVLVGGNGVLSNIVAVQVRRNELESDACVSLGLLLRPSGHSLLSI